MLTEADNWYLFKANFTGDAAEVLAMLSQRHGRSAGGVMARALALYRFLSDATMDGSILVLRGADGRQELVKMEL